MPLLEYKRRRPWLAFGIFVVIALGLASRKFPFLFPAVMGKYPGDALWALMVFVGIAIIKPNITPLRLAGLALATSYLVEVSQLYQAHWINAIRTTTLGHLVLGSTFGWLDLCAYAVGVVFGVVVDIALAAKSGSRQLS